MTEIIVEWDGRGSWESDDVKEWIEGVDQSVAAEIGKLILVFAQLEQDLSELSARHVIRSN